MAIMFMSLVMKFYRQIKRSVNDFKCCKMIYARHANLWTFEAFTANSLLKFTKAHLDSNEINSIKDYNANLKINMHNYLLRTLIFRIGWIQRIFQRSQVSWTGTNTKMRLSCYSSKSTWIGCFDCPPILAHSWKSIISAKIS